jgi:hypothetical protein
VAAALATLRHLGDAGYLELASRTRAAVRELATAVRRVGGLRLLAEPESTVVCFTAVDPAAAGPGADDPGGPDVFVLADELAVRGWHTQPQLSYADIPASIHLSVTAAVAPHAAEFGAALDAAVAAARALGPVPVPAPLRAMAASLTPEALTPGLVAELAAGLGLGVGPGVGSGVDARPGGALPQRMAPVNALLDAAPPRLREALLTEFLSLLQQPAHPHSGRS